MKLKPSEFSTRPAALLVLFCSLFVSTFALAGPMDNTFGVQNLTHYMVLTPPIAALCPPNGAPTTQVGYPASMEVEELAEGGSTGALAAKFAADGCSYIELGAPILPGEKIQFSLTGKRSYILTFYSMVVPSNDAFIGGPGMSVKELSKLGGVGLPAYDSGTEMNDELCVNIPGGGPCGGEGFNPDRSEGGDFDYVHPHPGIAGIGDLSPAEHGLANPVARIWQIK